MKMVVVVEEDPRGRHLRREGAVAAAAVAVAVGEVEGVMKVAASVVVITVGLMTTMTTTTTAAVGTAPTFGENMSRQGSESLIPQLGGQEGLVAHGCEEEDTEVTGEEKVPIDERRRFVHTYYQPYWCRRQHYRRLKKEKLLWNLLALLLVGMGVIIGPILTQPWAVACLTIVGSMVKGYLDLRRYDALVDMSRFAYTSYGKALHMARDADGDYVWWMEFKKEMRTVHQIIIDLCPPIPDKIYCAFDKRSGDHVDGPLLINTNGV